MVSRHGGTGGDDILDDKDAVPVLWRIPDQTTALAVILDLLTVEEIRFVHAEICGQGSSRCRHQRDALIGGAEQGVKIAAAGVPDQLSVKPAQRRQLGAGAVIACIDEVRREPSTLGFELPEAEHIRAPS